jgi:DNA-binding MarR family transcriptional regulator
VGELAQHTATHQSSVSVVARRLIERGLVARAPSPGDRRRVVLRLTPRGHALLRRAPASPGETLQAALSRLPSPTRRGLAHGLRALLEELGASHLPPSLLFEDEPAASPPAKKKVRP